MTINGIVQNVWHFPFLLQNYTMMIRSLKWLTLEKKRDNKFMRFVEACENINFQITEDNEDISDDDLLNSIKS